VATVKQLTGNEYQVTMTGTELALVKNALDEAERVSRLGLEVLDDADTSRDAEPSENSRLRREIKARTWEQATAYYIDRHTHVAAFVRNQGPGFAIPYMDNGQLHDYIPDFIIRLTNGVHLILETRGFDEREQVKVAAAHRWVDAVNADGTCGIWSYSIAQNPNEIPQMLDHLVN
jgi:type III restriction enzyme